ncbi:MAG TPA: PKD domain-containing protein, partial [Blastocatellia bacterium]
MPKIITGNSIEAIKAQARAHHYRLIGIEFGIAPNVTRISAIIQLGSGSQTSLNDVPHDIIIDRCFIHGNPTADVRRGIALNSARTSIIDSHISDCHEVGADSQAICGWNGPGPFKIVNNYLEGAAENVMFGGGDPTIPGLVPSDIEFRRNHLFKPLSWRVGSPQYAGKHWTIKNHFEIKNARRLLIDGNLFENNWKDAQTGYSVVWKSDNSSGSATWAVAEDITFINNIVRHTAAGISIVGKDNNYESDQTKRILIQNNLFYEVNGPAWGGDGTFLKLTETADLKINHNTVEQTGKIVLAYGAANTGFVFENNIFPHNRYGVYGNSEGIGNTALNIYFPGYTFRRNVLAGGQASRYPADNFFPATLDDVGFVNRAGDNYRLLVTSPFKNAGTDGEDIGADIDAIDAAHSGGQSSNQNPVVSITANPTTGSSPLLVSFSSQASDPDGLIASYIWDFGDGNSSPFPSPSHSYQSSGSFTARLTVTDNDGGSSSASVVITVSGTPPVGSDEVVLYASQAQVRAGGWRVVSDTTAAGGARIHHPNAGAGKLSKALANPTHYFEMTFNAEAGRAYRLWIRGKADNNS